MGRTWKWLMLAGLAIGGLGLASCSAIVSRHPIGNRAVPEPAKALDLDRYLGRWFELARYEQGFQKDCEGVTASYSQRTNGGIDVLNRCRKPNGKISEARGRAKVVDTATGAKLKVSFFGPFYGDYWVMDRSDDYRWAIVGDPSGRYLWILHREPTPPEAEIQRLLGRAGELGYDTTLLRRTQQP